MCHLSICTTLTTFCAYVFVCARESYFRLLIERNWKGTLVPVSPHPFIPSFYPPLSLLPLLPYFHPLLPHLPSSLAFPPSNPLLPPKVSIDE